MQEGLVMEIIKWFMGMLLLMTILAVTVLGINIGAVNNFKQQVNYEIERNGGLTGSAKSSLEEYSKENYNNRFKVIDSENKGKVAFGEKVDYVVEAKIEILYFEVDAFKMDFEGTAVSYKR